MPNDVLAELVDGFSIALLDKLKKAEVKYGRKDDWLSASWEADCQRKLLEHVAKGDPLDVAAYAAFCWHHGWNTSGFLKPSRDRQRGAHATKATKGGIWCPYHPDAKLIRIECPNGKIDLRCPDCTKTRVDLIKPVSRS